VKELGVSIYPFSQKDKNQYVFVLFPLLFPRIFPTLSSVNCFSKVVRN